MVQRVIAIPCFCTFYANSILFQFCIRFDSPLEYTVQVAIYSQQQVPQGHGNAINISMHCINTINSLTNLGASMIWCNVRIAELFGYLTGACNDP